MALITRTVTFTEHVPDDDDVAHTVIEGGRRVREGLLPLTLLNLDPAVITSSRWTVTPDSSGITTGITVSG